VSTLEVHAENGFSSDVPSQAAVETGLLVYEIDERALPEADGGPFRLFVPGAYDRRANVKSVARTVVAP